MPILPSGANLKADTERMELDELEGPDPRRNSDRTTAQTDNLHTRHLPTER